LSSVFEVRNTNEVRNINKAGHPERSLADFSAKRSRRTCISGHAFCKKPMTRKLDAVQLSAISIRLSARPAFTCGPAQNSSE
jgi:hypothetical protein